MSPDATRRRSTAAQPSPQVGRAARPDAKLYQERQAGPARFGRRERRPVAERVVEVAEADQATALVVAGRHAERVEDGRVEVIDRPAGARRQAGVARDQYGIARLLVVHELPSLDPAVERAEG